MSIIYLNNGKINFFMKTNDTEKLKNQIFFNFSLRLFYKFLV